MLLAERLAAGDFVVTAELGPPAEPAADKVSLAARTLASVVHAANVTDNQAATVKMSALACAIVMREAGLEPILQLTVRDRNLLALQSDLLGAWAMGVRAVLALSGDPLTVGPYEHLATRVGDVDSLGLTKLIAALNSGVLQAGETIASPTDFLIAGAANPLIDTVERLEAKLDAGARLLQTNIVYDTDRFVEWLAPMLDAGIADRAPLLVGVTPPRSTRMLRHLHDKIPGVEVDATTFARMEGLDGEDAKAEGIRIARDVITALRGVAGVAGVHIMAPGWETEAVPLVVRAAGLLDAVHAA
ncbi:MAG TPA: methylenetetrahydrofolate reductase [Solirubrobacteraceae bacterium]|nr:methylenetetrahydrofolate reductase [Solirubrobacteraceae bacterium]